MPRRAGVHTWRGASAGARRTRATSARRSTLSRCPRYARADAEGPLAQLARSEPGGRAASAARGCAWIPDRAARADAVLPARALPAWCRHRRHGGDRPAARGLADLAHRRARLTLRAE